MERKRNKDISLVLWTIVAALLSQNLLVPVLSAASVEDQKTYYTPDPHTGTPPTGSSHGSPPHGHGSSPPYHGTPTPSHGGGSPPSNCGTPPSGGHHHTPTPTPYTPTPSTPTPPTYSTPSTPTPVIETPPVSITPPSTPIDPGTPNTPGISVPSPPYVLDPHSPPFTCDYWRTHPGLVWGLLGWWGTLGGTFGVAHLPGSGSGSSISLQQALSNAHSDGFSALYREGTASLLNSMVDKRFPYTTNQVRDNFVAAIGSNKAAEAQARLFKLANEGHLKPRA